MRFKDRVRELRSLRNLTLKQLSEKTGLSVSYLSDVERGNTNPSLNTIEVIAQALEISVQQLITGVELAEELDVNTLPEGLREFIEDERYVHQLNDDWISLLNQIQMRGRRPKTKDDWLEVYLHLKRILGD